MSNKCLINVWNGVDFPNKKPNNFKILVGQTFFIGKFSTEKERTYKIQNYN